MINLMINHMTNLMINYMTNRIINHMTNHMINYMINHMIFFIRETLKKWTKICLDAENDYYGNCIVRIGSSYPKV